MAVKEPSPESAVEIAFNEWQSAEDDLHKIFTERKDNPEIEEIDSSYETRFKDARLKANEAYKRWESLFDQEKHG